MLKRSAFSLGIIGATLFGLFACSTIPTGLELEIVHTNDTHSYVAGLDRYGNPCRDDQSCKGGSARIAAAIKQAKNQKDNVLALDAGDMFQGTLFYSVYKAELQTKLNTLIPYDAITLGNHEFDDGCQALARYLERQPVPVVATNLKPSVGCALYGARYEPWQIFNIRQTQVAVLGLVNDDVINLSGACKHTLFKPAKESLVDAIETLKKQGISHVIVISHLGLPTDIELAKSVSGVDVIVGGHTHSYLGENSPDGPYPTMIKSPNGDPVLIVTAKNATQYLGELQMTFDKDGVLKSWSGVARELDVQAPRDKAVTEVVADFTQGLESFENDRIGSHALSMLDGMQACRQSSCFSGMLLAESMLDFGRRYGAQIAILNAGSVRAALPAGTLTRGQLLTAFPFNNSAQIRDFTGEQLWAALENGVRADNAVSPRLLQVAGLRYQFKVDNAPGSRITKAEVLMPDGHWERLDLKQTYRVVLTDFLVKGGDHYEMLSEGRYVTSPDAFVLDILEQFLKTHSPIKAEILTGNISRQ